MSQDAIMQQTTCTGFDEVVSTYGEKETSGIGRRSGRNNDEDMRCKQTLNQPQLIRKTAGKRTSGLSNRLPRLEL